MKPTLKPCPFCGEQPYPIVTTEMNRRFLECKCNVFLYRNRSFVDDINSRLETDEEMDANLIERWNRRVE